MKKTIVFLLVLVSIISLSACSRSSKEDERMNKLNKEIQILLSVEGQIVYGITDASLTDTGWNRYYDLTVDGDTYTVNGTAKWSKAGVIIYRAAYTAIVKWNGNSFEKVSLKMDRPR